MAQASTSMDRQPAGAAPVIVTVLGARSGTSALAGTLGLLGCALPANVMPANYGNTKGYFEPQDLAELHDAVLASVGSCWYDWHEFPRDWFASQEAAKAQVDIDTIYRANYGNAPLVILKEPRICRILPLWHRVFEDLGATPAFCLIDRSPIEVAKSLQIRDGSSIEQGLRYYIRNHLDAERDTRWFRRSFVSYDGLLSNWRGAIMKVSDDLELSLRPMPEQEAAIDSFLESSMRHLNLGSHEYPCDELSRIAIALHEAHSKLERHEHQADVQRDLDRLRLQFEALPAPA